jgi:hypothetical protein
MPKRKPDSVQVHRIELGTWERKQLEPTIAAVNLSILATGAGIAALGVGTVVVGYGAYKWLKNNAGIKWLAEHDAVVGEALLLPLRIFPLTAPFFPVIQGWWRAKAWGNPTPTD